ncbi:MAG: hypothetical protein JWM98_1483 [Thermoleophilia bacterium]|nr:hypothetical protein [Thermoleophilia bacterium]
MQLATAVMPRNPVDPAFPPHGPIGVGSAGTLRIGHALNGIAWSTHELVMPITAPYFMFKGSHADALAGLQAKLGLDAARDVRLAVALIGHDEQWSALRLNVGQEVVSAIETGAGHGGIAALQFTPRSGFASELVTAHGLVTATR